MENYSEERKIIKGSKSAFSCTWHSCGIGGWDFDGEALLITDADPCSITMVLFVFPIDHTHQRAEVGVSVIYCQLFNGECGVCCAGILVLNHSFFEAG